MGVVTTVIVVAMAFVAIERFEIHLVQNDSQQIIIDTAGSFESMSLVKLFSIPALTVFVCGLALWAMSGWLKKRMHGIH